MKFVEEFEELDVYKLAKELSLDIFEASHAFPREEKYSMTDQIRRSSRSVGAQIAEAWARRKYEKHFVSKLTDAVGEQHETRHWIKAASDCHYLTAEATSKLLDKCSSVGRMLNSMILKSNVFCNPGKQQATK